MAADGKDMTNDRSIHVVTVLIVLLGAWGLTAFLRSHTAETSARGQAPAAASLPQTSAPSTKVAAEGAAATASGVSSRKALFVNPDPSALSFEAPVGRYSAVIPSLRERAEGGDPEAAYVLSRLLIDCYWVGKGQPSGYGSNDPDRCTDIYVAHPGEAVRWLQAAADKGLIAAQLLYPNTAADLMSPTDMIRDPAMAQEYRERVISYLTQAAHRGSANAMTQLSLAYSKGVMADANPQLAYAYEYASEMLSAGSAGEIEQVIDGGRMTPAQIAAGRRMGEEILARCCK